MKKPSFLFCPIVAVLLACSPPPPEDLVGGDGQTGSDSNDAVLLGDTPEPELPSADVPAPDSRDDDADADGDSQVPEEEVSLLDGREPSDLALELETSSGLYFGATTLASDTAACAGVAGLDGIGLLAQKSLGFESTLGYVLWETPGNMDLENPTGLTVTLDWPESPKFVCYPEYLSEETGLTAHPRLAIPGLTLTFKSADGQFDEKLAATAWAFSDGANVSQHAVLAGIHYDDLAGTYVVPASISPSFWWMTFRVRLMGENTAAGDGTVGAWPESLAEYVEHAVYPGGAFLAGYPVP